MYELHGANHGATWAGSSTNVVSPVGVELPVMSGAVMLCDMQVSAVLVDEFEVGEVCPSVKAELYRFDERTWVSPRRRDGEGRAGPMTILDDAEKAHVVPFPERSLAWERDGRVFSYRESWTADPWTLYVLYPPPKHFASVLELEGARIDGGGKFNTASVGARLFYFALLGYAREQHAFKVEARLERDAQRVAACLDELETVRGRRRWETLRSKVAVSWPAISTVLPTAAAFKDLFIR